MYIYEDTKTKSIVVKQATRRHCHKRFKEPASRPTVRAAKHIGLKLFVFLGVFCLIKTFKVGLWSTV